MAPSMDGTAKKKADGATELFIEDTDSFSSCRRPQLHTTNTCPARTASWIPNLFGDDGSVEGIKTSLGDVLE